MPMFEEREMAAERKFERDQELAFRITARRNKLLGLWAAGHMGLSGDAAARYALSIVDAEVTEHGDDAVIRRIAEDLIAHGSPMTEAEIRSHLASFGAKARAQILQNAPP
jgi:hypothetical protein